jgi:hypothetical protein
VECDLFIRYHCSVFSVFVLSFNPPVISAISTAINVILREFETNCEPAFNALGRISWSNVSQVSGQSPYTADLVKAADLVVELIRPLVEQKKYLRNFFDKASRFFCFSFK